jgi:hypothetical protein
MAVCLNCKFYKPDPTDPNTGYCFGHEVSGDTDAALCPAKVYEPATEADILVADPVE